ncbi:mechanosensitive ion channel [Rhizobium leguminosarum]|uniref:mechanosensitive ion channel family protein n=1 Tax=Rhizobium leguminosarum TaxID=384 RepID=UPI001C964AAB|nr:mechanosensitive ion channel family protein [Rhizobium leguminosarum]MBY5814508.1 mechanosensitive ion channel [Rhizobium leguminosarum]
MFQGLGWSQVILDPTVQAGSLAVVSVFVTRIALRGLPRLKVVGQVLFFIALTVLLLYHGIVPYQSEPLATQVFERIFVALAKVIWWMNATWALVGFVRVFLKIEGQPREGRLVQDLVVGLIYLGAVLSVIAYVFGVPVGTLIATSGVFAIILGLAMQSTLSDVFSGIALNLGRPYSIGDWIVLNDQTEGKVVETNWRSTHLLNATNDLVVLPNSFLAKVGLTNLSSPDRSHGVTLLVRVAPTTMPSSIANVMRAVLLSSTCVLREPQPYVQIKGLDADALVLELVFRVADIAAVSPARNEIFDLIYRHLRAAGLFMARPLDAQGPSYVRPTEPGAKRKTSLTLLDAISLFSSLTEEEKQALAASMKRRTYKKDEIIIEEGDAASSLTIVHSGAVVATRRDEGRENEVGRLAPGDYFGETGFLLGVGEVASLRALTAVVVYEIDQSSLAPLLHERAAIAEELATTLSKRVEYGQSLLSKASTRGERSVPSLVRRIRSLFGVPN